MHTSSPGRSHCRGEDYFILQSQYNIYIQVAREDHIVVEKTTLYYSLSITYTYK